MENFVMDVKQKLDKSIELILINLEPILGLEHATNAIEYVIYSREN